MKNITLISSMENPHYVFDFIPKIFNMKKCSVNAKDGRNFKITYKKFLRQDLYNLNISINTDNENRYMSYMDTLLDFYEFVEDSNIKQPMSYFLLNSNISISIVGNKNMSEEFLKSIYELARKMESLIFLENGDMLDYNNDYILKGKEVISKEFLPRARNVNK